MDLGESAAGIPSVLQNLSVEPSFTRKKRIEGMAGTGQLKSEGILNIEDNQQTKTNNRAMSFRAGERRPGPAPIPSEYQVQFTWKQAPPGDTPLLLADRLKSNERGKGGRGDGGKNTKPSSQGKKEKIKDAVNFPQSNGHLSRGIQHVKPEANFTKQRKRSDNPSPPPTLSSKLQEQNHQNCHHHQKHKKEREGEGEREGEEEKKEKANRRSNQRQSRMKKHREQRQRIALTGQTEYQIQFKAWPISPRPSEQPSTTLRKVDSPRKKSDITDHTLITPSPLLNLPGSPALIWGTEYSTRFRSPLDFQYVRGAWIETPHPSPTPNIEGQRPAIITSREVRNGGIDIHHGNVSDSGEEEEEMVNGTSSPAKESLSAQLSEIRDKAEEYRQRSEGSHFLPVHPSWQLHPDTAVHRHSTLNNAHPDSTPIGAHSELSSSVSSLSSGEESGGEDVTLRNEGDILVENIESDEEEERRGGGEHSSSDAEDTEKPTNLHSSKPPLKPSQTPTPTTRKNTRPLSTLRSSGGRVPTPILRHSRGEETLRHHLDLTTPSSGAVLTSPPHPPPTKSTRPSSTSHISSATTKEKERGVKEPDKLRSSRGAPLKQKQSFRSSKSGASFKRAGEVKKQFHLSQTSAKFRRDPTLLSTAPQLQSRNKTQPTSSLLSSHKSRSVTEHTFSQRSRQSIQTSPIRPPPPSSPSTISSLLNSLQSTSSNASRNENGRFAASATTRSTQQFQGFQNRSSHHTNSCCTTGQCDICGAWLRSARNTGAQVTNPPSNHTTQPRTTVPLGPHSTRKYRGPVTQLSESVENRGDSSSHPQQPSLNQGNSHGQPSISQQTSKIPFSSSTSNRHGQPRQETPPVTTSANSPRPLRAHDELSVSTLSLSNCSVASDLLQRARERREKFWT